MTLNSKVLKQRNVVDKNDKPLDLTIQLVESCIGYMRLGRKKLHVPELSFCNLI